MITEDYVSFEVAKLLKENGFVTPCDWLYCSDGTFGHRNSLWDKEMFPAPTHQTAMKWLRGVHNIHIIAEPCLGEGNEPNLCFNRWFWTIFKEDGEYEPIRKIDEFPTYEQAIEAAIQYSLKNLI